MTDSFLSTAEDYLFNGARPRFPVTRRSARCAVKALLRTWPSFSRDSWSSREEASFVIYDVAYSEMDKAIKEEYGFVITAWLIGTVAAAALSWLIERILTRLFPDKNSDQGYGVEDAWERITELSKGIA